MFNQLGLGIVYCVGLLAAGSPPQAQTSPSVPLSIAVSQVDPKLRTVTFTVQNTGPKTITAWDVEIAVGSEPDAAYGGFGTDAFLQFEGLVPGRSYIVPNGTVTATANLPQGSQAVTPVSITPYAAVFADTSSVGNARYVQVVFDRRLAQLAAWQEIASQLDQVQKSGSIDATKLDVILSAVNDSIARNGADTVRRTFRTNLSARIADVRAGRAQALPTLISFLDEASRNVAAATAHSPR